MDPIQHINIKKDSTFAMLLAAQKRNWAIHYFEPGDLYSENGVTYGRSRMLKVADDPAGWFELQSPSDIRLGDLSVILMRKDPPFDMEYIYVTYLLELAQQQGCLIVNDPQALRDANEKYFTQWFPQCCAPSLVTRDASRLRAFIAEHQSVILKPLDGMGGKSIFRVDQGDPNTGVIIETLTDQGQRFTMAQQFIPEIAQGDKRILLIDGDPVPYALARVPAKGENRGNLAVGATGQGVELTPRDRWICEQISPTLRKKNLIFVGIDVIGDYLTEINITSPTCIRELDHLYQLDIGSQLLSCIEKKLSTQ